MAKENVSPEEKLFKVIQEEKTSPFGKREFKKGKVTAGWRRVKEFFNRGKPKKLNKKPGEAAAVVTLFGFRNINTKLISGGLVIILAALTGLVVHCAAGEKPGVERIADAISKIEQQAIKTKSIEAFKPVSFYLARIKERDIFKPFQRQEAKIIPVVRGIEEARIKLKEMAKDLKLVGISWGKSHKVMIRSGKRKNTYFLINGQKIGGTGIEVKSILKDKVIINYQGAEMELL